MLAARWAEAKVEPAAVAEDGEFLRRVSLDLIGKIPTAAEARDFLDDPNPEKRQALVERLLDSPAYTTRATELWRQLLLPEADTEDQARVVAGSFEAWLRRKVVEEAGYDRIVREILTAKLNDRNTEAMASRLDPSPAAYYVAKEGKPENLAAARPGSSSASAWNVPSAITTRSPPGSGTISGASPRSSRGCRRRMLKPTRPSGRPARPPRARELTIPGTKKVVKAAHLDGSKPDWRPRAETRGGPGRLDHGTRESVFCQGAGQPRLARFFGVGLIEPVDDLDLESDPEFAGLVNDLAVQFRLHDYNLKYLIRVVTATRAYGLSSVATASESSSASFAAMPVRGLSPDSFSTASPRPPAGTGRDAGAVPRPLRQSRGAGDRSADHDPASPDDDERKSHRGGDRPGDRRGARGGDQGPVPRHPGPDRNPLSRHADPAPEARGTRSAGSIRRPDREPRRSRQDAGGRLLGDLERAPSFTSIIDESW